MSGDLNIFTIFPVLLILFFHCSNSALPFSFSYTFLSSPLAPYFYLSLLSFPTMFLTPLLLSSLLPFQMLRVFQGVRRLGARRRSHEGAQVSFGQMCLSQTEKPQQFDGETVFGTGKNATNQQSQIASQAGLGRVQTQSWRGPSGDAKHCGEMK